MHFDDASKALVELAASRHNAFHSSEVADVFPARRLRRAEQRGELRRLGPRVWSVVALGRPDRQATRAATLRRKGTAICHRSGAWLHGWIPRPQSVPQLWVPGTAGARCAEVSLHRCRRIDPDLDISVVDEIRTLNRAATLCLLGRSAPVRLVERCLDDFTRTDSLPWLLATLDRLWAPNCGGTTVLAKILNDPKRLDGVTDSWMERLLADLVARIHVPEAELQHSVVANGRTYRLDLAFPSIRLGIEAHSRTFHWGPDKVDADNLRDLDLAVAGWEVLYITWTQLQDPNSLADKIEAIARARRGDTARSKPSPGKTL